MRRSIRSPICARRSKPGAPQVWPEAPGNIAVDWAGLAANPDEMAAKVDAAMKSAAHVARISLVHQRINVASMEPRGGTASYDAANDSYLLRVCSQGARAMRDSMAGVMGIPPAKIRVTTEEVGGAFGLKTGPYPEYIAMLVGAKKIGRPVFWMSGRNESFVSDNHARDAYSDVELALDDKGKFLALRIRHLGSMGAYIGAVGANIQTANMMRCLPGMYDIKLIDAQTKCVFTNTTPTAPYRGAGRPEASYCIERVVDEAARVTGIDPIRLRRKNLIPQKAMPYKTAVGTTYDSGDFATLVDKGLALADYDGFKARKKESKKKGLLRGLGICFVLEHAGGSPIEGTQGLVPRRRQPDVHDERAVDRPGPRHDLPAAGCRAARHQARAGRPRPRRQRARDRGLRLGRLAHRDDGGPRHGEDARSHARQGQEGRGDRARSRRRRHRIQERRLQRGRHRPPHVAVRRRGARQGDEEEGRDRRGPRHQGRHRDAADLPERLPYRRGRGRSADRPARRSPSYSAMDDSGNILDHTIVAGQVHGSVAMGVGQAMLEQTVYDDGGQLVSASFMDYAMPRAHHLPMFKDDVHEVPATTNPLGVKGAGEAGTTAAIAAVMNAFADAIPGAGHKIQMPATPEKVWKACQEMAG